MGLQAAVLVSTGYLLKLPIVLLQRGILSSALIMRAAGRVRVSTVKQVFPICWSRLYLLSILQ
ncbi:Uncharacterised protein [Mycobacteroides abscessus subsp. abscessus]|nr:Uncharacterised protein [Mycobacteroides abscessus subsp. abscessus]